MSEDPWKKFEIDVRQDDKVIGHLLLERDGPLIPKPEADGEKKSTSLDPKTLLMLSTVLMSLAGSLQEVAEKRMAATQAEQPPPDEPTSN